MSVIRQHLWITGRVQGVFFRQSTAKQADKIGNLKGWVRNLADGRVEVLVEGEADAVQQLLDFCQHGPVDARVEHIEQQAEEPLGDLLAFRAAF